MRWDLYFLAFRGAAWAVSILTLGFGGWAWLRGWDTEAVPLLLLSIALGVLSHANPWRK